MDLRICGVQRFLNAEATCLTSNCAQRFHQWSAIIKEFVIWFQFKFMELMPVGLKSVFLTQEEWFHL